MCVAWQGDHRARGVPQKGHSSVCGNIVKLDRTHAGREGNRGRRQLGDKEATWQPQQQPIDRGASRRRRGKVRMAAAMRGPGTVTVRRGGKFAIVVEVDMLERAMHRRRTVTTPENFWKDDHGREKRAEV